MTQQKRRLMSMLGFLIISIAMLAQDLVLPSAKKKEYYSDGFLISASRYDYSPAARQMVGSASSAYDKARAIYEWLTENVDYDPTGQIRTADACWEQRKGVCQGYCELYYRLAETVGLKVKLVYGNAKNAVDPSQYEKHVWLSVTTEKGDILMDPTWGAGFMVKGKFVRQPKPLMWFDTNPCWMIFTHMPQKHKHQHLPNEVSEADFARLPYLHPLAAKLGIAPREALAQSLAGADALPVIPVLNSDFLDRVVLSSVPLTRHLTLGRTYIFSIDKRQTECTVAIDHEGATIPEEQWRVNGKNYSVMVTPQHKGRLQLIVATPHPYFPTRKVVLEYVVE